MFGARAFPLAAAAATALTISLALAASAVRTAEASPTLRPGALQKSDRLDPRPLPACGERAGSSLAPACPPDAAARKLHFVTVERRQGTATTVLEKQEFAAR